MNKYYLDKEAYDYLCEWSELNKATIKFSPFYFKKAEVILKDVNFTKFIVENIKNGYKFNILNFSGVVISGKIKVDEFCKNDFGVSFKLKKELQEDLKKIYVHNMEVYCTAFLYVNSFMRYGNFVENKKFVAAGKNSGEDKVITFRKFKDKIYAIPVGSHRSPEGVFPVRGHFRRYKNGKVIWIDDFVKGLQK